MSSNPQENAIGGGERKCAVCGLAKSIDAFSGKQWANKAHSRKCKDCISNPGAAPANGDKPKQAAPAAGAKTNQKATKAPAKMEEKPIVAKDQGRAEKQARTDPSRMLMRYEKLADMLQQNGTSTCTDEEDPFICDITGALIDMHKDGRYHFDDGRPPDDDHAVCMSVSAYTSFDLLPKEHPETWEPEYADKARWLFISPMGP